jgi:bacterioferritin-associated ferredoxin
MYVCICNAITDSQIREAADAGVRDLWSLQKELGVATNCGSCKETASKILRENTRDARRSSPIAQPKVYRPAIA